MPVLGSTDRLPARPTRVLVAGTSGSGKTTTGRRIAATLGIGHVEIDALFHGPEWVPRPEFLDDVGELLERPAWVTEWQYPEARPLLAARTDLLVWLDLSRTSVMRQVVVRTLNRRLRRQRLWNGNVEPPLRTFLTDPEHIVRWAWSTHAKTSPRVTELRAARPDLVVVRLRNRRDVQRWLSGPLADCAASR